jgi:Flp pilus assembly pilin Flp
MRALPSSDKTNVRTRKAVVRLHKALGKHLARLLLDIRGQGLVEYALLLVLVAFATIATQQVFACQVNCAFELVGNQVEHFLGIGKKIPPGQAKKCSKKCA